MRLAPTPAASNSRSRLFDDDDLFKNNGAQLRQVLPDEDRPSRTTRNSHPPSPRLRGRSLLPPMRFW
ncbi:BQ5605_C061g12738 [Microbotryum silenes-dioicae]|uniref:BQ5605_C061g12738 protein n=1 Tax=Microbotryum silenes-dioicae TaxID=796604 RepID=A0A2X0MRV9_9BASI|nr:BQ5605_C061g12738 [Microbotryum silenes-dioicae]